MARSRRTKSVEQSIRDTDAPLTNARDVLGGRVDA
jgi:hypothetical protein